MSRFTFFVTVVVLSCMFVVFASAGTVNGKINFKGPKSAPTKIMMNADPKCVKMHSGKEVMSEQVIVNPNNTLQNVFVYVKKGLEGKKFPMPSEKKSIDQ